MDVHLVEHSFYVAGKGDSFLAKTAEDSSQPCDTMRLQKQWLFSWLSMVDWLITPITPHADVVRTAYGSSSAPGITSLGFIALVQFAPISKPT